MQNVSQAPLRCVGYATGSIANAANAALSALTWLTNSAASATLAGLAPHFVKLRSDQALAMVATGQTPTGITGSGTLGFQVEANKELWIDAERLADVKFLNGSGATAYLYAEAYVYP